VTSPFSALLRIFQSRCSNAAGAAPRRISAVVLRAGVMKPWHRGAGVCGAFSQRKRYFYRISPSTHYAGGGSSICVNVDGRRTRSLPYRTRSHSIPSGRAKTWRQADWPALLNSKKAWRRFRMANGVGNNRRISWFKRAWHALRASCGARARAHRMFRALVLRAPLCRWRHARNGINSIKA